MSSGSYKDHRQSWLGSYSFNILGHREKPTKTKQTKLQFWNRPYLTLTHTEWTHALHSRKHAHIHVTYQANTAVSQKHRHATHTLTSHTWEAVLKWYQLLIGRKTLPNQTQPNLPGSPLWGRLWTLSPGRDIPKSLKTVVANPCLAFSIQGCVTTILVCPLSV